LHGGLVMFKEGGDDIEGDLGRFIPDVQQRADFDQLKSDDIYFFWT